MELGRRAGKESLKFGTLFDSPDDACQEYMLRILEGHHSKATVNQAVVDMARLKTGRKGHPGYEARQSLEFAKRVGPDEVRGASHKPFNRVNGLIFIEEAMKRLKFREWEVVFYYLKGFNFGEIGAMLEITEAYAHRLWHDAIDNMKKVAEKP